MFCTAFLRLDSFFQSAAGMVFTVVFFGGGQRRTDERGTGNDVEQRESLKIWPSCRSVIRGTTTGAASALRQFQRGSSGGA